MLACLLSNALFAAVLALVVWAIGRWLRPAPATLHVLWLVVLFKLLSPFGLIYPLPLPIDVGQSSASVNTAPVPDAIDVEETFFLAHLSVDSSIAGPTWERQERPAGFRDAATSAQPTNASAGLGIWTLLLTIWAIGAATVALRQVWHTWRFARRAACARPASDLVTRHVHRLAAQLGLKPPRVRALPGLASPVVWALGRPVLLWPAGLEKHLGEGGRDAVLLHELAHLRRGDHWTRWLELVAGVLYWWNPFFWLARRQMRFHAELACDAWVTGTFPAERRAYAEALLQVCGSTIRATVAPAVGVGGDGRRDFQRRLTMIMREQVPCRSSGRGKLAAVVLALAALPGWVLAADDEPARGGLDVDGDGVVVVADELTPADLDREKKLKDLEAKIADLTNELNALRGGKPAAADKKIIRWEAKPEAVKREGNLLYKVAPGSPDKVRVIIIDAATGKIIAEHHGGSSGEPIKIELKEGGMSLEALKQLGEAKSAEHLKRLAIEIKAAQDAKATTADKAKVAEAASRVDAAKAAAADSAKLAEAAARADALKAAAAKALMADGSVRIWDASGKLTTTGGDVLLSRATYKLPREKADALAAFIKQHVQAQVLEIKADGDSLTVTTTPELQRAIRTLVGLMQTKAPTSAAPAPSHRETLRFHDGGVKYIAEPVKLDADAIKTWTDAFKTTPALLKSSAEPIKLNGSNAEPIKLNGSIKVEDAAKFNLFFKKPDPPAEVKPAKPPEQ
jgi:beta-lactamase regulating signal transducer with metallopeptidase domain